MCIEADVTHYRTSVMLSVASSKAPLVKSNSTLPPFSVRLLPLKVMSNCWLPEKPTRVSVITSEEADQEPVWTTGAWPGWARVNVLPNDAARVILRL